MIWRDILNLPTEWFKIHINVSWGRVLRWSRKSFKSQEKYLPLYLFSHIKNMNEMDINFFEGPQESDSEMVFSEQDYWTSQNILKWHFQ